MPLYILQCCGFLAGATTSIYAGYYYLLDPVLQNRYKNLTLLNEIEQQMFVDESKMTAELRELEVRRKVILGKLEQYKIQQAKK